MKLSNAILAHKLKSNFSFQCRKNLSHALKLEQVLFYCEGDDFLENKIYLCTWEHKPEHFSDFPEQSLLLYIGELYGSAAGKYANVFEFEADTNPWQLFNAVQRIFDHFDQWEQKLSQLAVDGNVQEMLDVSFRIFHNPLILNSADYFIIAYSSIIDTRPELSELVDPDTIFVYKKEYKEDDESQDYKKKTGAFFLPGYITETRNLCVNLFEHEKYAYRLALVEELVRFSSYEDALLELLAEYIQTALSKQLYVQTDMGYRLDRILSEILAGGNTDQGVIRQWFSEFGWRPEHLYFCITLKLAALDLEHMTMRFISGHIEKLLPYACAFPYENYIAIFVNLSRFGGDVEEALGKIVYFLRDSFLKAGISNEFTGFSDLISHYRQSVIALEVGNQKFPYKWVHRFDDIALDYLLEQCRGELPKQLVCARKILNLRQYDEKHNTDYFHTLHVYVKNHLNAVQTAKLLFIHRSTFLYRMEKIKELLRMDLDDYDMLLYVMITFKIMEAEEI
ncbi:MAG: hypothetical protein HFI32_11010 [Lachnospiraceae bacterium]|nr:hypothetical protein [Lachnospiraceae bacterium]